MDSERRATDSLPDELLLMIFRYLSENDLLRAEQVCLRWKAMVDKCFASKSTLKLFGFLELGALQRMRRYGPSLKSLKLVYSDVDTDDSCDWISEIGNVFPNLQSLSLSEIPLRSETLRRLPVKCCQLTKLSLTDCQFTDEDLRIVLQGFPRLKHLKLSSHKDILGECFRELGSNVEHLSLSLVEISQAGYLHILSKCTNLQTLKFDYGFVCEAETFTRFCKKSPLRCLKINFSNLSKEVLVNMSLLSLLEKLVLHNCPTVDSVMLIGISLGCPNLKYVELIGMKQVCDRGVRCFANCRHLTHLQCSLLQTVTDESLFEIAKACVSLETLLLFKTEISDRGVSAILAECPHLVHLDVGQCSGVGDSTVDAAIAAVESRRRLSHTLNKSGGKCTAIAPSYKVVNNDDYLLRLRMPGNALIRYKDGISHPLLYLKLN